MHIAQWYIIAIMYSSEIKLNLIKYTESFHTFMTIKFLNIKLTLHLLYIW